MLSQEIKGKIGLEIHVYLVTGEKLFCNCVASREKGLEPNLNICPICTGQPGAKPMAPNVEAIKKVVGIGLMLGCKINRVMGWQRKHYDWPDLPKGFQNTLSGPHAVPVGVDGNFEGIKIDSMHLEEDPASWDPKTGRVDYNRSGIPLVEIVTEPDFTTAEEVIEWLKKLVHGLSYLRVVDREAGIKVDVNVSIDGKTERVEIKNIHSFEDIKTAIDYEIGRQISEGSVRETRRFDSLKGETIRMRGKEVADDYRFIEDPDLQEIVLSDEFISEIERNLPESPREKLSKFVKKYGIGEEDASVLAKNLDVAEFYERVVSLVGKEIDAKFILPWVTVELLRFLKYNKVSLDDVSVKPEDFVSLLKLVKSGKVTELQAKGILNKFYPKSFDPSEDFKGKISDVGELKKIAEEVIFENSKSVEDYKSGEKKALNYLMGCVMQKTERRADFKVALGVLKELLD